MDCGRIESDFVYFRIGRQRGECIEGVGIKAAFLRQ